MAFPTGNSVAVTPPGSNPEIRPVTDNTTAVGRGEDAIVVGTSAPPGKTTATTQSDQYKTEFVKVYQDAGVIGASMLTLLVLCFLMGVFCLRLLKMYASLTQSRDALDAARFQYSERLTESLLSIRGELKSVSDALTGFDHREAASHGRISAEIGAIGARLDRLADANIRASGRRQNTEREARERKTK